MKKTLTFQKDTLMSRLLALALALALASCGENPAGPDTPGGPGAGDEVRLSAATGYQSGPQTRTEYSGYDESGGVVSSGSDYERIDWVEGHDRVRVLCAQSRGSVSADYQVGTPTADGEKSTASATSVSGSLIWSEDHSRTHYFLAMYPAPGTTSNYHEGSTVSETDATIEPSGTGGTRAVITGAVPAAQTAVKQEGSGVYKPNMNYAYMYATLKTAFTSDGSITLPFKPLVTAMEFSLLAMDDVMAGSDLLSLTLSSATTDLAGGFEATIDGTNNSASISETAGGTKSVTVTLPSGTRLEKSTYSVITVLALGIMQTQLTLKLNFAGGHARTLELKNKSGNWIAVGACKKAYFKLGVPAEEIFFEVTPMIDFTAGGSEAVTRGLDPLDNSDDPNHGIKYRRFGVFALRNAEGVDFDVNNNPANFFLENRDVSFIQTLSNSNTFWRGNAKAYWPMYDRLNFFAYAPHQDQVQSTASGTPTLVIPSDDYEKGMLRGTFTPLADITHQVDLCLSAPALNRVMGPLTGNNVPFSFKHALTRVKFYVNAIGDPYPSYKYQVTDLTLSGVLATNSFTFQNDSDIPFVWDTPSAATPVDGSYHLSYEGNHLTLTGINFVTVPTPEDPDSYTHVNMPDDGRLYLLPQTLTDNAQVDLYISLFKESGASYTLRSILAPFDVKLPTATAWDPGTTVSYFITLDLSRMIVLDVVAKVSEWQDAGNSHDSLLIF